MGEMKRWSNGVDVLNVSVVRRLPFGRHSLKRMGLTCKGVPAMWFKFTQMVRQVCSAGILLTNSVIQFVEHSAYKLHSTVSLFLVYGCAGATDNTTKFYTSFSVVHAV